MPTLIQNYLMVLMGSAIFSVVLGYVLSKKLDGIVNDLMKNPKSSEKDFAFNQPAPNAIDQGIITDAVDVVLGEVKDAKVICDEILTAVHKDEFSDMNLEPLKELIQSKMEGFASLEAKLTESSSDRKAFEEKIQNQINQLNIKADLLSHFDSKLSEFQQSFEKTLKQQLDSNTSENVAMDPNIKAEIIGHLDSKLSESQKQFESALKQQLASSTPDNVAMDSNIKKELISHFDAKMAELQETQNELFARNENASAQSTDISQIDKDVREQMHQLKEMKTRVTAQQAQMRLLIDKTKNGMQTLTSMQKGS